jgi:hypothetical protein
LRRAVDLTLALPRPQYVSIPEALIVALAARTYSIPESLDEGGLAVARVFRTIPRRTKTLAILRTEPFGSGLDEFGDALKQGGLVATVQSTVLAKATLNSIAGTKAERGQLQPASPMTPSLALLQNMRGLQGTANPPDLAEILESLDRLGFERQEGDPGVAELWALAARRRLDIDPLLGAIDRAVDTQILGGRSSRPLPDTRGARSSGRVFEKTPFSWFSEHWRRLTSDEWVDALPARVWVDWATTVLRLAVGMGYLWEANWYEALARTVLDDGKPRWESIAARMPDVVPWKSARIGPAALDVAPLLLWRIRHGGQVRRLVLTWLEQHKAWDLDCDDVLGMMAADSELKVELTDALGNRRQSSENQWEAVKYALKTRDEGGPFADYYGLLQANGRYLRVNPGTEWMAVVASLACGSPGKETNLGEVLRSLADLGLRPEIRDLVSLLERAGMARGSADADQGVVVRSAF